MIDFRYHIVSIVAIFLALAVGIVLGSGPLEDDIGGFLEDRTAALANEKVELQDEVGRLRGEAEASDEYAVLVQPNTVRSLLTRTSVALVVLPEADGDTASALTEAVDQAGGTVVESVEMTASWTDPDQQEALAQTAEEASRGSLTTESSPAAAEVVASALLTDSPRLGGQPFAPATATIAAFEEAGFLTTEDDTITRAETVIVVGSQEQDPSAAPGWQELITSFAEVSRAEVVVGPAASAEADGVVAEVRDSDLVDIVSTVDWVETAAGVTTAVLALADQLRGTVGQYGTGPGSSGPAPDPVPAN